MAWKYTARLQSARRFTPPPKSRLAAGALEWIIEAAISGVLGLLIGAATLPIVEFAVAPAWSELKRLLPGRQK
jgi:hypothetical protein